jgi:outer membrane protein
MYFSGRGKDQAFRSNGKRFLAMTMALSLLSPTGLIAQQAGTQAPATAGPASAMPENPKPQALHFNKIDYSRPNSHFPNPIAPYIPHQVAAPVFSNTPRIQGLVKDGKIYLSLSDAIALALENNLDLAIARYNLSIADTDILRAKAGTSIRGVNTGLVSGTPGGGQGGFGTGASGAGAGGTSSGAGGVGGGGGGIVTSTTGAGGPIPQYDPSLNGTLQLEHSVFPLSNTRTTGVSVLAQNTGTANFSYNQGFATGTALSIGFNNNRQTTNNLFTTLSPALNSSFRATVTQPLLQGFGLTNNLRFIKIAQNNKQISDSAFRSQVITTVSQIQNIYWDLVNAYEDVRVKNRSVGLANKTLSDNKKQVDIGTLAPIEIVRADSEVAARNQDLIISQTNLELQQDLMKNAISRSLDDPTLAALPVVPTDTMNLANNEVVPSVEDLLKLAMAQSPDLEQSIIDLKTREINRKGAKNALLPTVDLFGFYGASALGGAQNGLNVCGTATTSPCVTPVTYGSTFGSLFDSTAPDKGAGISINIPLRNRAAQADQVRSELEFRQAQLRQQQLKNTINIQVKNAQFALVQNRARVDAAVKGRTLADQSLDAEQKRYQLGASTNTLVLQAQRDLAVAESNYVAALSTYEKSRVELDRVTGNTLKSLNIILDDSASGVVNAAPTVPSVVPATQQPAQQPAQPQQQ